MFSYYFLLFMFKNDCVFIFIKFFFERFSLGILFKLGNCLKILVKIKNCYVGGFLLELLLKCNRIFNCL